MNPACIKSLIISAISVIKKKWKDHLRQDKKKQKKKSKKKKQTNKFSVCLNSYKQCFQLDNIIKAAESIAYNYLNKIKICF